MKICEICQRKFKELYGVIYIPNDYENYILGYNFGFDLFVCQECWLCYLSQYNKITNREMKYWEK